MVVKKLKGFTCILALILLSSVFSSTPANPAQNSSDRISMDVDRAPLSDVLKMMSEQSKVSYVASEEAESRKISLSFDRVPIEEALESIAAANNLRYEKKSGGKVILFYAASSVSSRANDAGPATSAVKTETRIYRLKYSRLSISPIDVGGGRTIEDLSEIQKASFDTTSSSETAGRGSIFTGAATQGPSNLTAARGIDRVVASLLTPDGKVTADIHSNSLIITDIPSKLDEIEKVLRGIDRPAPQVLIEVYLMEIKKNVLTDIGVEWGGSDGALVSFEGGSRTTGFPFTENLFNKSKGVKAADQGTSTLTLGTLSANDFKATLHYLTQDLSTKILARPRVLTISNEAADIKLVTNAAIANQTTLTTSEGQAVSTSNTAERAQVGITMKMTPQVNSDQTIGLFLEPTITTVSISNFFPTTFLDPTTRMVRTVARVKNHQTLVIGGLTEKDDNSSVKKMPILGDLPWVGKAFKYDDSSNVDRELVIFITPHIIDNYDSFGGSSFGSAQRTDTALQKILSAFEESQIDSSLDQAQVGQSEKDVVYGRENELLQGSAKDIESPLTQEEMDRSLDAYAGKVS